MHLATVENEEVYVAALYYCVMNEKELLFASALHSKHMSQLLKQHRCAVSIAKDAPTFDAIQGMQIQATLSLQLPLSARQHYQKSVGVNDLRDAHLFALNMHHIKMTDNTKGFGYKESITL